MMRMQRLRSAVEEEKMETCITGKVGKIMTCIFWPTENRRENQGDGFFCKRKEDGGEIGETKTRGAEYGSKRQRKEQQIDNSLQSCL